MIHIPTTVASTACSRSTDLIKEISGGAVRVARLPHPTLIAEGLPRMGPPLSPPPPGCRLCTHTSTPQQMDLATHAKHMDAYSTVQQQEHDCVEPCKHCHYALVSSAAAPSKAHLHKHSLMT